MGGPIDGVLPPRMPLPFMLPFILPFIGGRGPVEDTRGGAEPGGGLGEMDGATAGLC